MARPRGAHRSGFAAALTRTLAGALSGALCLAAAASPLAAQRSVVIEELRADIEVRTDGDLLVTETIRPRFTGSWNGLERRLELRPPAAYGADYLFRTRVVSATDERGRELRVEDDQLDRDTRRIRVWIPGGAEDTTVTVVLTYRVGNALGFFEPDSASGLIMDELYWQVTGTEWEVPILESSARVRLPGGEAPVQAAAYVGGAASTTQAPVTLGDDFVTVSAGQRLDPGEGLTVAVGWRAGAVTRPPSRASAAGARPQSAGGGRVGPGSGGPVGPVSPLAAWPLLLPFGVLWLAYRAWDRRGRDPRERAIAVRWEPPEDLKPAEAGTLVDHDAGMQDVISTLVDLAVRGLVVIEEREKPGLFGFGKEYVFHLMKPSGEWSALPDFERDFLSGLFKKGSRSKALSSPGKGGFLSGVVEAITGPGAGVGAPEGAVDSVLLSDLKNEFYKVIPGIKSGIYRSLVAKGHYDERPDKVRGRWIMLALACIGVGAIGSFAGSVTGSVNGMITGFALLAAGIGSAIVVGVFGWLMPARTVQGARTREAALGFKRFLERVESPRYRRMIRSPDQFEQYLPFAMAFRCEEQWAKAFEDLITEPPDWYRGSRHGVFHPGTFASDLGTLSTAAVSTLSSSPSSSGSGGGGSVGGGGGGGGGGGF